jgi:hypothetical protein
LKLEVTVMEDSMPVRESRMPFRIEVTGTKGSKVGPAVMKSRARRPARGNPGKPAEVYQAAVPLTLTEDVGTAILEVVVRHHSAGGSPGQAVSPAADVQLTVPVPVSPSPAIG